MTVLIAAAVAYAATNVDDIFLLTVFFARCTSSQQKFHVTAGHFLGMAVLTIVSLLGAAGLHLLPVPYIRCLGIIPLLLGLKSIAASMPRKNASAQKTEPSLPDHHPFLHTLLVTVANGADNLGVYIPLFAGYSTGNIVLSAAVFALLSVFWCSLADNLSYLPLLKAFIQKHSFWMVPVIYISLGLSIIL